MRKKKTPTDEVVKDAATFPRDRLGEPLGIDPEAYDRWKAQVEDAAQKRGAAALALELFPIMRHIQNLPSRYTRAPGPGGNGDRVADLLSADAYKIGTQAIDIINEALGADE